MKKRFLPFGILLAAAGVAVTFLGTPDATYTPIEDRGDKQEKGIDVAHEFFKNKKANQLTGTVTAEDVQAAREQVRLHNLNAKTASTIEWEEMGPNNVGGRTRAVLVDKDNSDLIYAGSVSGGLWVSNSGGLAWRKQNDLMSNMCISSIVQAANGDIYIGTGADRFEGPTADASNSGFRGNGIFKKSANSDVFEHITGEGSIFGNEESYWQSVYELNSSNGRLFAATEGGLKYSDDGGETWNNSSANDGTSLLSLCHDVQIGSDGSIATSNGSDFYYSESGDPNDFQVKLLGDNSFPQMITTIRRIEFAIAPSNPSVIYCAISVSGGRFGKMLGVYRSVNRGDSWEIIAKPDLQELNIFNEQATYDMAIAVDPANEDKVYVGGLDLWTWTKEENWTKISQWSNSYYPTYNHFVHADQHTIVFDSKDSKVMYIGNDGGVFKSVDGGESFKHMNRGYNVTQFYAVGYSMHGEAIGGTQDNGTQMMNWKPEHSEADIYQGATPQSGWEVKGGDGGFAEISRINSDIMFIESQFGGDIDYWLQRTKDKGLTMQYSSTNNYKEFISPYVADYLNTNGAPFITPFALWENPKDLSSRDSVTFVNSTTVMGIGAGDGLESAFSGMFETDQASAEIDLNTVRFYSGALEVVGANADYYSLVYDTAGVVVDSFRVTSTTDPATLEFTVDFGNAVTLNVPVLASFETNYEAGDTLSVNSMTLEMPLTHVLTASLASGDSVRIQDPIQSKFFLSAQNALFMTRRPLDLNGAPVWSQIASLSESGWTSPSYIEYSADGNYVFYAYGSKLYRLSRLKYADTHDHADVEEGDYTVVKKDLIKNFGGQTITGLDVCKEDPNKVVATLGNYNNNNYVYVTANALSSTVVFHTIQGDLPTMPVYDAIFNVADSSQIVVATEFGVWSTNINYVSNSEQIIDSFEHVTERFDEVLNMVVFDTTMITETITINQAVPAQTPSWTQETNGLGNIPCYMIKQQWYEGENKGAIYLATHGRGMYKSGSFVGTESRVDEDFEEFEEDEVVTSTMNVYPNPVSNQLTVDFVSENDVVNANISIYDLTGKKLIQTQVDLVKGSNQIPMDVSTLPKGTYLVHCDNGVDSQYAKIVKAY